MHGRMAAVETMGYHQIDQDGLQTKKRAACDECRIKKLKCSGEQPSCSRCMRENIICVYSRQKQMGRPKKRQRQLEDEVGTLQVLSTDAGNNMKWNMDFAVVTDSGENGHTQDGRFDLAGVEAIYTNDEELQPWLVEPTEAWAEDVLRDQRENGVVGGFPSSISDSSSDQTSLHASSQRVSTNLNGSTSNGTGDHRDASTSLLLNPMSNSLNTGLPSSITPKCACLSTMYLTLNSLQSMEEPLEFPYALHPLREAIKTTTEIVGCEECPKRFITGVQNTQIMGTVVVSIAERFGKVLESIASEATRAELAGETKKFRLADLNTSTSHLHAGGLGCISAFNLNLSPAEWRSMCKKVVRAEIFGPTDGNNCCIHFTGLTRRIEDRQDDWIHRPPPADTPKDSRGEVVGPPRHLMKREDHICLKLVQYANQLVEQLDWT